MIGCRRGELRVAAECVVVDQRRVLAAPDLVARSSLQNHAGTLQDLQDRLILLETVRFIFYRLTST